MPSPVQIWTSAMGAAGIHLSLCPQRYFVLENGILKYATTRQDVSMGLGCSCAASPWDLAGGDPVSP